ncbi:MAG: hypothetical protein WC875_02740 [Candidatus Absconditabacterales bacterium]|jgi:hypothetical protein
MKIVLLSSNLTSSILSALDQAIANDCKNNLLLITDKPGLHLSQYNIPHQMLESYTLRPYKKIIKEQKLDVLLLHEWNHPTYGLPVEKLISIGKDAILIQRHRTKRIFTAKGVQQEEQKRKGVSIQVCLSYKNSKKNDQTTFFEYPTKIGAVSQQELERTLQEFHAKWILHIVGILTSLKAVPIYDLPQFLNFKKNIV